MIEEVKKKKIRERAMGTVGFTVAGFPVEMWKDWENDCKRNFGDCRWIKMWNDHLRAKDNEFRQFVLKKIKELETRIEVLSQDSSKSNEQEVGTMSGNTVKSEEA